MSRIIENLVRESSDPVEQIRDEAREKIFMLLVTNFSLDLDAGNLPKTPFGQFLKNIKLTREQADRLVAILVEDLYDYNQPWKELLSRAVTLAAKVGIPSALEAVMHYIAINWQDVPIETSMAFVRTLAREENEEDKQRIADALRASGWDVFILSGVASSDSVLREYFGNIASFYGLRLKNEPSEVAKKPS